MTINNSENTSDSFDFSPYLSATPASPDWQNEDFAQIFQELVTDRPLEQDTSLFSLEGRVLASSEPALNHLLGHVGNMDAIERYVDVPSSPLCPFAAFREERGIYQNDIEYRDLDNEDLDNGHSEQTGESSSSQTNLTQHEKEVEGQPSNWQQFKATATPEQLAEHRKTKRAYAKKYREEFKATATSEQLAEHHKTKSAYAKKYREKFKATATPEQLAEHHKTKSAHAKKYREKFKATATPEQLADRREKNRLRNIAYQERRKAKKASDQPANPSS